MPKIQTTNVFDKWLRGLDMRTSLRIQTHLQRMEDGNFGDSKPVGAGVSELRMDIGPGYRAYYIQQGKVVVVMLCGGDKSSQAQDILRAHRIAEALGK